MKKIVLSVIAAAAIAGSAFTLTAIAAQDSSDGPARAHTAGVIFDAKIAGMKAELKLTPDQEKLWPAFELAVRDAHKMRMEMMRDRREEMAKDERPSPIEVMTEMSDHLAKASDELKKVTEAAKPLYDSFDDTQKRQFGPLLMMLRQGGPQHGEHGRQGPDRL